MIRFTFKSCDSVNEFVACGARSAIAPETFGMAKKFPYSGWQALPSLVQSGS